MTTRVGYARVSTTGQNLESQLDALHAAGCEKVFSDKLTGKLAARPGLDDCLAYLRPGDTLVANDLTRVGRSIKHLIDIAATLQGRGIHLRILKENIDTSTVSGRLMFHLLASIGEFQRELIVENTNAGLAAARARGRVGGRKPVLSPDKLAVARDMYAARTHTVEQIADVVGCSRTTLYRQLKQDA